MNSLAQPLPASAVNGKLIALMSSGAVCLGVILSGFVIREPAPYELYMSALIAVWTLFGLRISRAGAPLAVCLVLFNTGGLIAMTQMADLMDTPLYLAVSLFLAATAVFFAAVIEARPELCRPIFIAYVVSAVFTSTLGILGYFAVLPGAEVFTRYGRAAGAFQDPNVFGPFLVLPAIYLLHRLLTGNAARMPLVALPLVVIVLGIFLSFSRGAWGLFGASVILLTGGLFLHSASGRLRLRIMVAGIAALALLIVSMIIVLQVPSVAEMLIQRAQLVQDYDAARLGRFARYAIGFKLAMEHPLGIGPLVFGQIYGEDTHNIWLKALLDYGWLGFASWTVLMVWTLAAGFRILFRDRPWQPYFLPAYVVLVGHVALGSFIDTDHWRHLYVLLGIVWGTIGLEWRWQRRPSKRQAAPALLLGPGLLGLRPKSRNYMRSGGPECSAAR